jgi:serine/threonine protein kinase
MDEELASEIIARFEADWQEGNPPDIRTVWAAHRDQGLSLLKELVHIDFEYRFHGDQDPSLEQYLERFPELLSDRHVCADLVLAELEQQQLKQGLAFENCLQRFPNLRLELLARQRTFFGVAQPSLSCQSSSANRNETERQPIRKIEQYDMLDVLGRGQFGTVFRAIDTQLDRTVAVKIPNTQDDQVDNPHAAVDLNLFEARQVAKLNHPHIVPLYQIREWEGSILLVYQYVSGDDLAKRLRSETFTPHRIAEVISLVADAIAYGHSQGILHRDIKPSNILIDETSHVWLTDFGLAFDMTQSIDHAAQAGTLAYMAPEVALKHVVADGRSDVYSLGVVLYQALTGVLPFRGSADALIRQLESKEAISPRILEPSIPRDLELVCMRAIRKSPADRYQSAKEFADDLRRYLRREPVHAGPITTTKRLIRWCQRRPALATLGSLLITSLITGGWLLWQQSLETQKEAQRAEKQLRTTMNTLSEIHQRSSEQTLRSPDLRELVLQVNTPVENYYQQIIEESADDFSRIPELVRALIELGNISNTLGKFEQAEQQFQRAIFLMESDSSPVTQQFTTLALYARMGLAASYRKRANWNETIRHYDSAYRDLMELQKPGHGSTPMERKLLLPEICWYLGEAYRALAEPRKSMEFVKQARANWMTLASENNDKPFEIELAKCAYLIGSNCIDIEENELAIAEFQIAAKLFESCTEIYPQAPNFQRDLGASYHTIARLQFDLGNSEASIEWYRKAIRVRESLVARFPTTEKFAKDLAGSKTNLEELLKSKTDTSH